VTSETQEKTDPWVEELGGKYPYAYEKSRKLMTTLGLSGYPSAALIDSSGVVVWTGHPSGLKDAEIEKHLSGALSRPLFEWPKSAKAAAKAMAKGKLASAVKAAEKLRNDPDAGTLHAELQAVAAGRVTSLRNALAAGNYLAVTDGVKRLKKQLKGLPEAKEVAAVGKELSAIKGHKSVVKAQKQVLKVISEKMGRKKDCQEVIDQLERIKKRHGDNAAGRDAAAQIPRFQAMLKRFRN